MHHLLAAQFVITRCICSHMNSQHGHEAGDIVQLILKEFFLSASYLHEMAMFTLQK